MLHAKAVVSCVMYVVCVYIYFRETLKIVKDYFPAIALQNQKLLEGDKFWHDLVSASSDSCILLHFLDLLGSKTIAW